MSSFFSFFFPRRPHNLKTGHFTSLIGQERLHAKCKKINNSRAKRATLVFVLNMQICCRRGGGCFRPLCWLQICIRQLFNLRGNNIELRKSVWPNIHHFQVKLTPEHDSYHKAPSMYNPILRNCAIIIRSGGSKMRGGAQCKLIALGREGNM